MKKSITLLFLCAPVWANLSPQQVRDSALKHHPTVKGAIDRMLAGEEGVRGAKGAFDTKLIGDHFRVAKGYWERTFTDVHVEKPLPYANAKVYTGYSYGFNGKFPPQYSTWSTNSGGTPRVGLMLSLWRHFSIDANRAGVKTAKLDAQIAKGEKLLTEWDIARLGEIAYWEWVTAQRIHGVFENLLKNGESRNEYLTSRAQRGDSPKIMVRENEQYVAQRRAGLMAVKERLVRSEYELSLFLRDDKGDPVLPGVGERFEDYPAELETLLKSIDLETGIDEIARRRPELINLGATLEKAKVDLHMAEQDLKPKVDVWGDYTRNIGNEDLKNPPHIWSFGVKLEIPIERNLGLGNVAAARNRQRAAERDQQLGQQSYHAHMLASRQSLRLQMAQVEQAAIELARAKELVEAETYKFKTGGGNLFLVNLREQAQAQAEASWHEARLSFMSSYLSYKAMQQTVQEGGE